jgi:hypothetical protein
VNPNPILVLVAQDFDERTNDALGFLTDSGVPVYPVPVTVYEDEQRRRLYLIDSDFDDSGIPEPETPSGRRRPVFYSYHGRRVTVADLIEAGHLNVGETIEYRRAREGVVFTASLSTEGRIRVEDGREFESLSRAAATLANVGALPGWEVWTAPARGGRRLMDLRSEFLEAVAGVADSAPALSDGDGQPARS